MSRSKRNMLVTQSFLRFFLMSMALIVASAAGFADTHDKETARMPTASAISDPERPVADLNADDATDVEAAGKFANAIHELVYAQDYDHLEKIAVSVRSSKAKFSGGLWKIHAFYGGTSYPYGHATEEDWAELQKILDRWVAAKPESITARVALAYFYVYYGWNARGDGMADTVTKSGWRLFGNRLQKARDILEGAATLKEKCPEWYLAMQLVARGQGWAPEQAKALLEQATVFEPGYYYYYRMHAIFMLPKWYGEQGDSEAFIEESADKLGGEQGNILYFRTASYLVGNCEGEPQLKNLSFSRIRDGFNATEKQYGVSLTNLNLMAAAAAKMNEPTIANALFQRIGDSWSNEAWPNESSFRSTKEWARNLGPGMRSITDDKAEGEANMKTPEGKKYNAEFQQKYGDVEVSCLRFYNPANGPTELYFKLDEKGVIGTMMAFGKNPAGACLYQLSEQKLTPPSRAPFWIKLIVEPAEPAKK